MKTSEALKNMYHRVFNEDFPPDNFDVQGEYTRLGLMFAQAARAAENQLNLLTFKIPADVLSTSKTDPVKAKQMLAKGIVGCMVWEGIIDIENAGPTEEEWATYLNKINFWDTLDGILFQNK